MGNARQLRAKNSKVIGKGQRNRTTPSGDPIVALWKYWIASKGPVLGVVARFAAVMLVHYALVFAPFYNRLLDIYVGVNARIASAILNGFGEQSRVCESTIWCDKFAITILRACAALEYPWFVCAAVLAFPVPFRRKIPGILAGCICLPALNLIRAMTLYVVGVHFPRAFDTVHEEIWSVLLIIATIGVAVSWLGWACQNDGANTDAAKPA